MFLEVADVFVGRSRSRFIDVRCVDVVVFIGGVSWVVVVVVVCCCLLLSCVVVFLFVCLLLVLVSLLLPLLLLLVSLLLAAVLGGDPEASTEDKGDDEVETFANSKSTGSNSGTNISSSF